MTETRLVYRESDVLPFFDGAIGVVEGNEFAMRSLSTNFMERQSLGLAHSWVDVLTFPSIGVGEGTVGTRDSFYMILRSAMVDGRKVIFYEPRSSIVNHEKIREFFQRHLPASARHQDGRPKMVDPMGFDEIFV